MCKCQYYVETRMLVGIHARDIKHWKLSSYCNNFVCPIFGLGKLWASAYKGIECECSFWETESDCFEWSMHCNTLTSPGCVLCWDFWHLIKVLDIKSLMIMCWPNLCTECSSWHVMIGLDTEKTWRTKVKISKTKIEVLTNIISKVSGLSNSVLVSHLHLMQLMTSYERPQG